jgi:hypothetical protein
MLQVPLYWWTVGAIWVDLRFLQGKNFYTDPIKQLEKFTLAYCVVWYEVYTGWNQMQDYISRTEMLYPENGQIKRKHFWYNNFILHL